MKNKGNLIISIIAVLISLVALVISIIAFWSSCKMEYDSGNAIMSAFSIIVTILIGTVTVLIAWQVYNHYVAKDEVRKMVEEESLKMAEDIKLVIESTEHSSHRLYFDFAVNEDLDAFMRGIETAKGCHIPYLRDYSIDYALELFHRRYLECKKRGVMRITKGKRKEYEYLCADIDHKYIEELRDYIQNAEEIEDES